MKILEKLHIVKSSKSRLEELQKLHDIVCQEIATRKHTTYPESYSGLDMQVFADDKELNCVESISFDYNDDDNKYYIKMKLIIMDDQTKIEIDSLTCKQLKLRMQNENNYRTDIIFTSVDGNTDVRIKNGKFKTTYLVNKIQVTCKFDDIMLETSEVQNAEVKESQVWEQVKE